MDNDTSKLDAFPREIMVEILSWVPVESLFRFKSLNKSWYFFIRCLVKDPGFVSKHLRHSESSPAILLVCEHERGLFDPPEKSSTGQTEGLLDEPVTSARIVSFSTDNKEDGELQCVTKDLNLPCCLSELISGTLDVYCCKGIVCLPDDSASAITLYNPALCDFETFRPSTNLELDEESVIGIGFGCDTTGSVYKVVRFFESMKAEVFVLGETSGSWREIDMSIEVNELDEASHVYLKGNCFWSTCERSCTVICFDVGGEAFHKIPLPDKARDLWLRGFGRCKDSICVMLDSEYGIEVWTLDVSCCQSSCSYSWKKLLTTESFFSILDLRTFWDVDRGEILADNEDGAIESYNLFNGRVRSLPFGLSSEKVYYLDHYIESLVSIKSLNKARNT